MRLVMTLFFILFIDFYCTDATLYTLCCASHTYIVHCVMWLCCEGCWKQLSLIFKEDIFARDDSDSVLCTLPRVIFQRCEHHKQLSPVLFRGWNTKVKDRHLKNWTNKTKGARVDRCSTVKKQVTNAVLLFGCVSLWNSEHIWVFSFDITSLESTSDWLKMVYKWLTARGGIIASQQEGFWGVQRTSS